MFFFVDKCTGAHQLPTELPSLHFIHLEGYFWWAGWHSQGSFQCSGRKRVTSQAKVPSETYKVSQPLDNNLQGWGSQILPEGKRIHFLSLIWSEGTANSLINYSLYDRIWLYMWLYLQITGKSHVTFLNIKISSGYTSYLYHTCSYNVNLNC